MDQRLVIDELVDLGRLGLSVEEKGPAEAGEIYDGNGLVGRCAFVDDLEDALLLDQVRSDLLAVPVPIAGLHGPRARPARRPFPARAPGVAR